MKKVALSTLLLSTTLFGVDLGVVNIEAEAQNELIQENSFTEVFEEPEYIEKVQRLKAAPAQKRLTTQEAMFIPGVQGDPVKAMQSLGGVTSTTDTSGELFVYGSKPEETSTTIDHLPIGYLFHFGGLHSVISPEAIDQIDAYLAGFDSSYGNAMGAVLDVTPKYPDSSTHGYGHVGIYDSSAGINVALSDDLNIYFGARRSYFDLALEAIGKAEGNLGSSGDTTYQEFPNYYDATLTLAYNINSNSILSLEMITANDRLEINTQTNKVRDPEATGTIKGRRGFTTIGTRYRYDANNYHTQTLLYNLQQSSRTDLFDGYYADTKSRSSGLYHESVYEMNKHKIMAGLEFVNINVPLDLNISRPEQPYSNDVQDPFSLADKYHIVEEFNINSLSLFLEDIYALNDSFSFRYGARFASSNFLKLGSYIDPRFSAVYRFNDSSNISLSIGQYTQIPEGYKFVEKIGNPDLGYEQAYHYLLHYDYSFWEASEFSIEPFYRDFKDLTIDSNATQFSNGGKGYAYGTDISLKVREGDWYGFIAYTYLQAKRELTIDNKQLEKFYGEIPHTLQIIGAYKFMKNWSLSTLTRYHSGALYTPIIGTENQSYTDKDGKEQTILVPIKGDRFSKRLPAYFTLNLKLAQTIKLSNHESLEWSFELLNLTNHDNISSISYDDEYKKEGYTKQLPILPWFDVTYKF